MLTVATVCWRDGIGNSLDPNLFDIDAPVVRLALNVFHDQASNSKGSMAHFSHAFPISVLCSCRLNVLSQKPLNSLFQLTQIRGFDDILIRCPSA